jgi:hypothetical protein
MSRHGNNSASVQRTTGAGSNVACERPEIRDDLLGGSCNHPHHRGMNRDANTTVKNNHKPGPPTASNNASRVEQEAPRPTPLGNLDLFHSGAIINVDTIDVTPTVIPPRSCAHSNGFSSSKRQAKHHRTGHAAIVVGTR